MGFFKGDCCFRFVKYIEKVRVKLITQSLYADAIHRLASGQEASCTQNVQLFFHQIYIILGSQNGALFIFCYK